MRTISRTIELTEAQIEGLNTGSPVQLEILEPTASGKSLLLLGAQAWKTVGGASTDGTATINIFPSGGSTAIATFTRVDDTGSTNTGFLGAAAPYYVQRATITTADAILTNGLGISISASAAIAVATGTTAKIKLDFQIIDL